MTQCNVFKIYYYEVLFMILKDILLITIGQHYNLMLINGWGEWKLNFETRMEIFASLAHIYFDLKGCSYRFL